MIYACDTFDQNPIHGFVSYIAKRQNQSIYEIDIERTRHLDTEIMTDIVNPIYILPQTKFAEVNWSFIF